MRSVGACSSGSSTTSPRAIAFFADAVAGEIERAALAGLAALGRPVLRVDGAHARRKAGRADHHPIADRHRARQDRAGDDRAGAGQRKRAIDREPEATVGGAAPKAHRGREQRARKRSIAFAGHGRDRNDFGSARPVGA